MMAYVSRLAAALILVMIVAPGTKAHAGDKQKAQRAIDQLATQMQADGTVTYSDNCGRIYFEESQYHIAKGGKLKSEQELRHLILSGRYEAQLCVSRGSLPARLTEFYDKKRLFYFPMAINNLAQIVITRDYSFRETWQHTGSIASYDIYRKYFDPNKTKYVKATYSGTVAAYIVLIPFMREQYKSEPTKIEFCKTMHDRLVHAAYFSDTFAPCLSVYPDAIDEFLGVLKSRAAEEVKGS